VQRIRSKIKIGLARSWIERGALRAAQKEALSLERTNNEEKIRAKAEGTGGLLERGINVYSPINY